MVRPWRGKAAAGVLAAAVGAAVLCGAGRAQAGAAVRLREAHTGTLFVAPVFLAQALGYFADEGLQVELVEMESGQLATTALVAGEVHVTDADPFQLVQLQRQGQRVFFFYNLANRVTLDFVMRTAVADRLGVSRQDPLERRLAALRGLRLGITRPGAATDQYTRYYVRRAGMDPDRDVQIVTVGGGAALLAAMRTGQIDGFMLSPPTPGIAEAEGIGRILIKSSEGDVPEFANFLYTAMATTERFARGNEEVLRRYVRALNRANAFLRSNFDQAVARLAPYYSSQATAQLAQTLRQLLPALSADGVITEESMRNHLTFLYSERIIPAPFTAEEGVLWTSRYLR
ncbi:MAG TPA: ABC transporter substrate-binding protein [Limnochordales bacterium]